MKKIRIVFVALALGLWIPMAVLVQGALQSVSHEREVRHQTLAERVFDEMERQLGELSERETTRSFAQYSFYLGGAKDALRSELSMAPSEAYVVGYFQIDPNGVFSTPRVPKDRVTAIARGDWPAADDPERALNELRRLARKGIHSKREWVAKSTPEPLRAAASESAFAFGVKGPQMMAAQDAAAGAKVDSYQSAVRNLNRAADRKLQLKRKEFAFMPEVETPSALSAANEAVRTQPARASRLRSMGKDDRLARRFELPDAKYSAVPIEKKIAMAAVMASQSSSLAREGFLPAREGFLPAREAPIPRGQQIVEVDSIVGNWVVDTPSRRSADTAQHYYVVLHRTATLAGRQYRQGLVIDAERLADWLRSEVLRGNPLENRARLELVSAFAEPESEFYRTAYQYQHRFVDPFDEVSATLSLPVLADAGGAGYLYVISGLLMIVGTVGLYALYRMVAVTVGFAEQRNNFVAAVSHELKTPLTAIRMYGEMLRDDMVPTEEKRREYYATITAESERLTRLINNVLEFSRLEQGTREMSLVAGAVGPVIAEAAALLEPHARVQGFAIEVDVSPDLPAVRFDRDALLQVVFNLVDNALKYARSADDRVIRLEAHQAGDTVVLLVRDRGPGVPAEHLPKIFEPFYRGQKELTRTAKGTGIGLALVKGLCERMGAAVSGRNGSDGGFEVLLTFRLA